MTSSKVTSFFKARLFDLCALTICALGAWLFLTFASYDPYDPSLNLAVGGDADPVVKNWMGSLGAYIAVPTLELIGGSTYIISFIIFAWGIQTLRRRFLLRHVWFRVCALLLLIPAFCASLALFDLVAVPSESWPSQSFGGHIGYFTFQKLTSFMPWWAMAAAIVPVTLFFFYVASGLSLHDWKRFGQIIYAASYYTIYYVTWFFKAIGTFFVAMAKSVQHHGEESESTPSPLPKRIKISAPKPPKIKKEEPVASEPKPKRTITRLTERQSRVEQASFDLDMHNDYQLPSLSLLQDAPKKGKPELSESALQQNAEMLENVLEDFGVQGKVLDVRPGPMVTLYAFEPAPGTKSSRVIGLADDIARSMSAISARIAVVPGQNAIGIELPNQNRHTVYFRELLEHSSYKNSDAKLPIALGKDIGGQPMVIDLAKTPHMLVAGTTGSGKSVAVNSMILSLLYRYSPDECKFIMVDPKMLELSMYDDIPHLLTPVVTEPGKAVVALKWTVKEMENRYRLMSNLGVRNVEGYNKKILEAKKKGEVLERQVQTGFDPDTGSPTYEQVPLDMNPMPFIVVIVDEMADLMLVAGKDIEQSIQRLAQMARAAGIHIILATQRPSVDVITGVIKANFPTRVSFSVTSKIDSRTVLGEQGAEQLLGMGDMLYMAGGSKITRVHGPFVDDKEVHNVVKYVKQYGEPSYVTEVTTSDDDSMGGGEFGAAGAGGDRDENYQQAVNIVRETGKASTSFVQRSLRIGYNRAANIIEQMEKDGIITEADHVGRRKVVGADE